MLALRAPVSTLGGVAFSAVLFVGLAKLISVPFEVGERVVAPPIVLKKPRPDTPEQTKRDPQPVREQPTLQPGPPDLTISGGGPVTDPVPYSRPTLDTRPGGRENGLTGGIDGDVMPIVRQEPVYPPRELSRGTEGWVLVQFSVTRIGTVRDAFIVESEPDAAFDDAALTAIARWRYNPRVVNGEAVERVGMQTVIRFQIEN